MNLYQEQNSAIIYFRENIFSYKNKYKDSIKTIYQKFLSDSYLKASDYLTILDILEVFPHYKNNYTFHYILLHLFQNLSNGGLCLNIKKLVQSTLDDSIKVEIENFPKQNGDIVCKIGGLIQPPIEDFFEKEEYYKLLIYDEDYQLIYFQKYYINSQILKKEFHKRLNLQPRENAEYYFKEVTKLESKNRNFKLNKEQLLSVILSLYQRNMVISGGPGTGKTTIISRLCEYYLLLHKDISATEIILSAPTGKAAQRLSEVVKKNLIRQSIQLEEGCLQGSTLHRLLGYNPKGGSFYYNKENPIEGKLFIVDEVSMLDVLLTRKFLEALPDNSDLILVGDRDQLPSVEAGAVLTDIIPEKGIFYSEDVTEYSKKYLDLDLQPKKSKEIFLNKVVLLKQSLRQKESSAPNSIIHISQKINKRKPNLEIPKIETIYKDLSKGNLTSIKLKKDFTDYLQDVVFIDQSEEGFKNIFHRLIRYVVEEHYNTTGKETMLSLASQLSKFNSNETNDSKVKTILDSLFQSISSFQILCVIKNTIYGTNWINSVISRHWRTKSNSWIRADLCSGMPIIVTQNDPSKKLFNGNTGICISFKDFPCAVFQLEGDYFSVPLSIMPEFEISFAITVHKSQGSEYESVFIVLPEDTNNSLLTREILYTGLTRAKSKAIICGSEVAIQTAIQRGIERETGIYFWES